MTGKTARTTETETADGREKSLDAAGPRKVSVDGVTIHVDPTVFDDWEVTESLYALQADPKGGALEVVPLMRRLLAGDYERVKNALRDPDTGRIPVEAMAGFLDRMLRAVAPNS